MAILKSVRIYASSLVGAFARFPFFVARKIFTLLYIICAASALMERDVLLLKSLSLHRPGGTDTCNDTVKASLRKYLFSIQEVAGGEKGGALKVSVLLHPGGAVTNMEKF